MDVEAHKRAAAARALDFVQPGHAARARHRLDRQALRRFARRAGSGGARHYRRADVRGDAAQAEQLGIKLTTLEETPELDLTVDGADESHRT